MNIAEVRRLFAYNEWANARIVLSLRSLEQEQLERRIESSFPSIQATLGHIVSAEWIWLRRWKGESPESIPAWALEGTLETLVPQLTEVETERAQFLAGMSDGDLERKIAYRSIKGDPFETRFDDMFRHVVNHSTYHRGQLTTMIRQVGGVPPSTDFVVFTRS